MNVTDQAGGVRPTQYREANVSSPNYSWENDHSSSQRAYFTPWTVNTDKLRQARLDFLGESTMIEYKPGSFCVSRRIPHHHPNFPNELYATSCAIDEGISAAGKDANNVGCFNEARMRVTYSAPLYPILTDAELTAAAGTTFPDEASLLRYCTIDQQAAAKFQTIPSYSPLVWSSRAGAPGDGGPTIGNSVTNTRVVLLFEGDLTVTWHDVPIELYSKVKIKSIVGKTNSAAFGSPESILGESYPVGTLVCGVPKKRLKRMTNGKFGFDVTYYFKYYPFGANYFYFMDRNKTPGFYPAAFDTTGAKPLYESADFRALFRGET